MGDFIQRFFKHSADERSASAGAPSSRCGAVRCGRVCSTGSRVCSLWGGGTKVYATTSSIPFISVQHSAKEESGKIGTMIRKTCSQGRAGARKIGNYFYLFSAILALTKGPRLNTAAAKPFLTSRHTLLNRPYSFSPPPGVLPTNPYSQHCSSESTHRLPPCPLLLVLLLRWIATGPSRLGLRLAVPTVPARPAAPRSRSCPRALRLLLCPPPPAA